MAAILWDPVRDGLLTDTIRARPRGLWTPVLEFVKGPLLLKIVAAGRWEYLPDSGCDAAGHLAGGLVAEALSAAAPIGALIAKIGGGTSEKPSGDSALVFPVGDFCVISLKADDAGALFLTMNDRVGRFPRHSGHLTVALFTATAE